ncbi:biotin--[acetyl-CoA-carboxylase] ligase [Bacillus alkalicellulosilyticus]|uniref:biotin--[acetyl-CoA-carboxylase] ligase n=1 Tax=Alkalihalobacterium alkalicellulosilyticum TaxID=1912214 RepID=UPI000997477F|nr:biotin--[acetyl-CoA-carboxylase] ligase [Bacillus alkalicellulosilyticus]
MKAKLLELLESEQFVSGEKISVELGCSRTAVWKHIEELRKNGYEVEAVPRKGYRIISRPNTISPHEIKMNLKTKAIGQEISYYKTTSSTQEIAHRLAQEGAVEGHVVIADEQTKGKGRMGREWHSPHGSSISLSIILRPKIPPQKAPQLTLLAAVSVVRGIKQTTGIDCDIKWPNDLLINGKKVVGILTEMQSEPDYIHSVIIGIGINVNHQEKHFSPDIKEIATSLAIEKKEEISRATLLRHIFSELEILYEDYIEHGFTTVKSLWECHAISLGKRIKARTMTGTLSGVAKGITDEGVLLLEDDDGVVHHIYSADIDIS